MSRSLTEANPELSNIVEITRAVHFITANTDWISDMVLIHARMRDSNDRKIVAEVFQSKADIVVSMIDLSAKNIERVTGSIKTARTAAQATAVGTQVSSLQKLIAVCR